MLPAREILDALMVFLDGYFPSTGFESQL